MQSFQILISFHCHMARHQLCITSVISCAMPAELPEHHHHYYYYYYYYHYYSWLYVYLPALLMSSMTPAGVAGTKEV